MLVSSSSRSFASCVAPRMFASVEYAFSTDAPCGRPRASSHSLISRRPPSSSTNAVVEPRLVDAQVRVREQAVAVEALDVVALVRRAVAPDVDAVLGHRLHEQRPGDGAAERRRVEVAPARPSGCGTRRTAARRSPRGRAAPCSRRARRPRRRTAARAPGTASMSGSSYWPRSAVNAYGIGAVLAHPGERAARVEAAGEGDADALADRQRGEDRRPAARCRRSRGSLQPLRAELVGELARRSRGSRETSSTVFSPAIVPAMCGCRATSIACASALA